MSKPIHGNYKGYYSKRPFINDPRLKTLPDDLFRGKRVLDIGCNEGFVTCEIAQVYGARRVIGVDLDYELVQSAWKRRRVVWSLQSPLSSSSLGKNQKEGENVITGQKRKRLEEQTTPIPNYFPKSCPYSHGPLPVPSVKSEEDDALRFPHNVTFKCADWNKDGNPDDAEGYDVLVAFSISKWIHLNEGDDGLVAFFRRAYNVLRPGGTFVLEPQPWTSYAKARKMDEKLRDNAKLLKMMPDDFGRILKEIGFEPAVQLGFVGEGGFSRPIDLYKKL